RNLPRLWARRPGKTSRRRKQLIRPSMACSVRTKLPMTWQPGRSRKLRPMRSEARGSGKLRNTLWHAAANERASTMTPKVPKKRLDALLIERELTESPQKAQAMILAGEVQVNAARAGKAGARFAEDARIEITSRTQKYASRGGTKLEGALADFVIDPAGKICVDVGSSTGGFTDCLLQQGAARIYAVDVNVDQLAWKLRQDTRVVRVERNARELRLKDIGELADL